MVGLGIAVVGLGRWGPNVLRAAERVASARIVATCDRQLTRARAHAPPAASSHTSIDEVLQLPQVEAVAICTPPASHATLALRALRAGRHVLVEKPGAVSLHEADDLRNIARDCRRVLMVGHQLEFHAGVRKVRELTSSWGRVRLMCERYGGSSRGAEAWWAFAPHDVSLALGFHGSIPPKVRTIREYGAFRTELDFGDSVATLLHAGGERRKVRRLVALSGHRAAVLDDVHAPNVRTLDAGGVRWHGVAAPPPLDAQLEAFVGACVSGDERYPNDSDALFAVTRVLCAGEASRRAEGSWVDV